jgi:hypothetical protein
VENARQFADAEELQEAMRRAGAPISRTVTSWKR